VQLFNNHRSAANLSSAKYTHAVTLTSAYKSSQTFTLYSTVFKNKVELNSQALEQHKLNLLLPKIIEKLYLQTK
jgi:hypothetical protein